MEKKFYLGMTNLFLLDVDWILAGGFNIVEWLSDCEGGQDLPLMGFEKISWNRCKASL